MIKEFFEGLNKRGVSPVIAIVLLLMMTVAAAGAAYFWLTSMQSSVQESAGSQIEAITKQASTRIIAQATICKGINEVNLKGYWEMDEGSGGYANDSSKYENDGTLKNGPTWVNGKVGQALDFDGNNDAVDLPGQQGDYIGDELTIILWVKADYIGNDYPVVGGGNSSQRGNMIMADWGRIKGIVTFENGTSYGTKSEAIDDGNWRFVAFTFDGTSSIDNYNHYIDGENVLSKSVGNKPGIGTFNYRWSIGGTIRSFHYWNGTLDEARIYDKALSQAQVEYLYNTNKAMGRYVNITVYNAGTEEVPKGAWVANLKKDGTTVDSDSYNASKLPPEERITLNFYFDKMKPNKEYTIELEGTATSTTVSC